MPLTVRVDVKTERMLQQLAHKQGRTKSEIIRDAIGVFAKEVETKDALVHPYENVRDLIGSVKGGPTDLSKKTGENFRQALVDRRRKA